ncbi:hypothetical protein NliqN6_1889 [Naganishia liquefaciens]|uniref:Uncharacterized protein n=1 Tax=Naganishia liquefaciens TaxID=104408 RepID=A0A8H3TQR2_9TREE|nr:hypothetical protein NliqN6_1889 [Naganishia liquefaciens]
MTSTTKIQEKEVAGNVWQADIRSPSPTSSLDLSSREDHAKVEINPFSIAAKNKRSKVKQSPVKYDLSARPQGDDGEGRPRITVTAKDRDSHPKRGVLSRANKERHVIQEERFMQSKEATQPPFQLRPPIQAQTLNKSNLSPAGKKALTPSEQKHPLPTPSISGPRGKGTPIRFAKIEGDVSFPILQGFKRQEQPAHRQQSEQRRIEPQRMGQGNEAEMKMRSQAMQEYAARLHEPHNASSRLTPAYPPLKGNAPLSTLYGRDRASESHLQQLDPSSAAYADSTESQYTTMSHRLDVEHANPSVAFQHQRPSFHYYPISAIEANTNVSRGACGDVMPHGGFPLPAESFPLVGDYHSGGVNAFPYRSTRMSLPSTHGSRISGQYTQGKTFSPKIHREPALSLGRSENGAKCAIAGFKTDRKTQAAPHFRMRAGATGFSGTYATSFPPRSPLHDSNWSTLPERKATNSRAWGFKGKGFRLPPKLLGGLDRTTKADAVEPSQGSGDSATEIVLPLRRPKLTLFQPSPPKFAGNAN